MRFTGDDLHRPRRAELMMLSCVLLATIIVAALVPRSAPWLASPVRGFGGAAILAALGAFINWFGPGTSHRWERRDDLTWFLFLLTASVVSARTALPMNLSQLALALGLCVLCERGASRTTIGTAFATVTLPVFIRLAFHERAEVVITCAFVTMLTAIAMMFTLRGRRSLGRSASERDLVVSELTRTLARHSEPRLSPRNSLGRVSGSSGSAELGGTVSTRAVTPRPEWVSAILSSAASSATSDERDDNGWDSFVERVRNAVRTLADGAGVATTVSAQMGGLAPPSTKTRTQLIRLVQEATSQAIRLTEPRELFLSLKRADGGVVFEIEDRRTANDGARHRKALSLVRGRIAPLGGSADLRRTDGGGWITRVRLPWEQLN